MGMHNLIARVRIIIEIVMSLQTENSLIVSLQTKAFLDCEFLYVLKIVYTFNKSISFRKL